MFSTMLSAWDSPRPARHENEKVSVVPPIKDYKIARAKARKKKRKTGGPK